MGVANWGTLAFRVLLGFLTHYLVRRDQKAGIGDLGAIVGVLLGSLLLDWVAGSEQTSWYLIGLCIGFFIYWLALLLGWEQVEQIKKEGKLLPLLPFIHKGSVKGRQGDRERG